MQEPDYSGVEPLRLPEARRRVAAITEYLRLPKPTIADADRHAAKLGLRRHQFYRLARVWREHRKPSLLVIGRRGEATRDYGIDKRALEIAAEEIAAAGSSAELSVIAPLVEARCATEGCSPPSRPTLWEHIRKARAGGGVLDGPPEILIGRFWFHLPIAGAEPGNMPMLLAAVMLPERVIVAHAISTDAEAPPPVGELIATLVAFRTSGAAQRPLIIEAGDRRAAADILAAAGLGRVTAYSRSTQRALARAYGDRLGQLKVIYRRGAAKPATKRVVTRLSRPLDAAEARDVLEHAIEASNDSMPANVPTFDIANR